MNFGLITEGGLGEYFTQWGLHCAHETVESKVQHDHRNHLDNLRESRTDKENIQMGVTVDGLKV